MPIVSIIVPVYNVENYLRRCVDSIRNQTMKDIEIILVDDGSSDGCGAICDVYAETDSRIKVIHKTNGGLSDARNTGIEMCTGQYIAFIDSDDWIDKDMMEMLYLAAIEHQADIVECSFRNIYIDRIEEETTNTGQYITGDNLFALQSELRWQYFKPIACNKIYARKIFDRVRFPVGRLHEDEFTTHQAFFLAQKLVSIDSPKYNYDRTREDSITGIFKEKNLDICDAMYERLVFMKKHKLDSLIPEMQNLYFYILLDKLYKCYEFGIYTDRVKQLILYTRNNYFKYMELNIEMNYKFELSLLQTSYKWFVWERKYKLFKNLVKKTHWFFTGRFI